MRGITLNKLMLLTILAVLPLNVGCLNLAANLLYAIQGDLRPAEYEDLEEKRVVLVCGSDGNLNDDTTCSLLESHVSALLNMNVDEIDLVRSDEVDNWLDTHQQDHEYADIGAGLKADQLVAIELSNLTLRNGATLYRGQCDISVKVYDIARGGKIVFRKDISEFAFPQIGGTPVTEVSEAKFRGAFVAIVAQRVAGLFYEVESTSDFALDAKASSL